MWETPVARRAVLETLVAGLDAGALGLDTVQVARGIAQRDAIGSTHVGDGVDLPHARIDGLARPAFAIGLTRAGVEDAEVATEVVWLLLLPSGGAGLATTTQVARACRDRAFRCALRRATNVSDVRRALADWERVHETLPDVWRS